MVMRLSHLQGQAQPSASPFRVVAPAFISIPMRLPSFFTIKNDTGKILTLDGSALALIDSVDCYCGSSHISSIQGYANLVNTLSDFTSIGQHYVRGVADTKCPTTYTSTALNDTHKSRNGVVIAAGASETFCLPLVNCLGTLAQKALPL